MRDEVRGSVKGQIVTEAADVDRVEVPQVNGKRKVVRKNRLFGENTKMESERK